LGVYHIVPIPIAIGLEALYSKASYRGYLLGQTSIVRSRKRKAARIRKGFFPGMSVIGIGAFYPLRSTSRRDHSEALLRELCIWRPSKSCFRFKVDFPQVQEKVILPYWTIYLCLEAQKGGYTGE